MMQRIVLIAALLTLAACDNAQDTALLDSNKAQWDVIAAAPEAARVKNNFLIMMR
jgi:hypothetical protein